MVDGSWLRGVGFTADLQTFAATFGVSTEANRLRYYLTVTWHGLRPWVTLQTGEIGALKKLLVSAAY